VAPLHPDDSARRRDKYVRALSVVALLLLASPSVRAAEDVQAVSPSRLDQAKPASVITERVDSADLRLGKSQWVVSGPITDSLQRRQPREKRSLGRRIRELPIVRLLVPKPMPSSSGEVEYFRWRESSRPWASIAYDSHWQGSFDRRLHMDGGCTLISVSR